MGEIIIGILLILLSAVIYFNSGDFQQVNDSILGPGSYPKLVAALLGFLAIILVIKKTIELIKTKKPIFEEGKKKFFLNVWKEHKIVFLIAVSLGLYIILMNVIGFIISSIIFIIASGLIIGSKKKKDIVLMSVISITVTLGMYFFFENVLYVRFPDGILF